MKAKSVRQLLDSAAHVEVWKDNVGWVAEPIDRFYRFIPSFSGGKGFYDYQCIDPRSFSQYYRIVTVKGKAIA